ncbi:hypothetical protein BP5796_04747 [Coleophoma crateriformis]|uniref:Uncharacterized protein n=1 Tax=Coleophoma crateriformis TaxID=565419 RepID=A0A3D8SAC3_9HELO|nr:hypothetical protein BP5796_04747 [Coleophoma crateriformis]
MSNLPSRTRSLRKPAEKVGGEPIPSRPERGTESPSRLPVKPTTRPRPLSLSSATLSSYGSMGPPPRPAKANTSKPVTSTAGLQRSTSIRRPVSMVGTSSKTDPVKPDRSTTTRPPQAIERRLRHGSVSTVTSTTSRVPEAAPVHGRTRSQSTILTSSSTLRPLSRRTPEETSRASLAEPQLRKPAFSTLQQHYSPAKNLAPKPHPAAFLVPPTPSKLPSNIAISAETAKLQNELLQLHLLHKDAARVESEWRASAKQKLGQKFEEAVKEHEGLVRLEEEEMGKINAAALKQWGESWSLEEKTQALDEVLGSVWNLGEAGGKYARVVRKFEKWLTRTQSILKAREHNEEDEEIAFVDELDGAWKDDCLMLSRKLETWRDQLRNLGIPEGSSNLSMVVQGCRRLVEDMLQELAVMTRIEQDAVRMENEWIESMNEEIIEDQDGPSAGAIWRAG